MSVKHDPEMCMCERCIRVLLRAHAAHLAAWIRNQIKRG